MVIYTRVDTFYIDKIKCGHNMSLIIQTSLVSGASFLLNCYFKLKRVGKQFRSIVQIKKKNKVM